MYALIEYVRFEIKRIKNNNKITVFRVILRYLPKILSQSRRLLIVLLNTCR